jgi:macrolide transport system ATP-binding/permease protein
MPAHITSTNHIRVDGISHAYGERRVLTDVGLVVDQSERLGLIGENGAGKSTLLRIMAGAEEPDVGVVSRPASTGLLSQEVRHEPGATVGDLITAALAGVRDLERQLEDAASGLDGSPAANERYSLALTAAERADVWGTDARLAAAISGLGVDGIPFERRLDEVSGGQRSRLALAALLLERPTALLLDEPTNHLDDSAVAYLRDQLLRWQGPVVFASHDRAFLDEAATVLVDIDPSRVGVTRFRAPTGSAASAVFSDYLVAKAAERKRWEEQFEAEKKEESRLRASVAVTARGLDTGAGPRDNDKFLYGFKAGNIARQVSRRVRNAQGRLDDLVENRVRKPTEVLTFAGIPHGSHALDDGVLITVREARLANRLNIAAFSVEPRSRVLVTGANGAGKSTMLGMLAGSLALDSGTVSRRKGLRVALLEQDVRFREPHRSAIATYEATVGERRAQDVPLTSLGLIAPRDLNRPVAQLSIGQQRRLALALIIARPPHVFLLDEPANHLSLALATELEDALGSYPGAVVVASHDRWLRQRWSGASVALRDGTLVA